MLMTSGDNVPESSSSMQDNDSESNYNSVEKRDNNENTLKLPAVTAKHSPAKGNPNVAADCDEQPPKPQPPQTHSVAHEADFFAQTMKAWKGRAGNYRDYSHLDEADVMQNLLLASSSKKRNNHGSSSRQRHKKMKHASDVATSAVADADADSDATEDKKPKAKKHPPSEIGSSFPMKMHHILSSDEYGNAIVWLPHGRAWKVVNMNKLERDVLPVFFNHGRRESFRRQVDTWNFKRIVMGPDVGAYYHEVRTLFMRMECRFMK